MPRCLYCECCAQLVNPEISKYRDRRFEGNQEDFERTLRESTTVYVGNLSFFTTEEQIYEVCRTAAAEEVAFAAQTRNLTCTGSANVCASTCLLAPFDLLLDSAPAHHARR